MKVINYSDTHVTMQLTKKEAFALSLIALEFEGTCPDKTAYQKELTIGDKFAKMSGRPDLYLKQGKTQKSGR